MPPRADLAVGVSTQPGCRATGSRTQGRRDRESCPPAEPGCSGRVGMRWRDEPDLMAIGPDLPSVTVHLAVAEAAEHHAVVEIGRSGIAFPPADVVGMRVRDVGAA